MLVIYWSYVNNELSLQLGPNMEQEHGCHDQQVGIQHLIDTYYE